MSEELKTEIDGASKEFASGFKDTIGDIAGSGWLIVDPLSGFLNACGYKNKLMEIPASEKHPQVLIIIFDDGTQFIPAGSDLGLTGSKDWMWINATKKRKK